MSSEYNPKIYTTEELSWGLRYIKSQIDNHTEAELNQIMHEAIERRRIALNIADQNVTKFLTRKNLPPFPIEEIMLIELNPENNLLETASTYEFMKFGYEIGFAYAQNNPNNNYHPENTAINIALHLATLGFLTNFAQGHAVRPSTIKF